MRGFFHWVVRARKVLLAVFLAAAVLCLFAWSRVSVNYDIDDYLPDDSPSTVAIEEHYRELGRGDLLCLRAEYRCERRTVCTAGGRCCRTGGTGRGIGAGADLMGQVYRPL